MIFIVLGPPASGKGTQSKIISDQLNIPHISTGDIFRWKVANRKTEDSQVVKHYIDQGLLVPDELTIKILEERISLDDCKNGFVLDGFPRTIIQVEALDKMLAKMGKSITLAIDLEVPDDEVVRRISGRRVCSCGKAYHIDTVPPKVEGICDVCGKKLTIRKDDTPKLVRIRLEAYKEQTEPIIQIYEKRGLITVLNGDQPQEAVTEDILKIISSYSLKI